MEENQLHVGKECLVYGHDLIAECAGKDSLLKTERKLPDGRKVIADFYYAWIPLPKGNELNAKYITLSVEIADLGNTKAVWYRRKKHQRNGRKSRYSEGDFVTFRNDGETLTGNVEIVDYWCDEGRKVGREWSYDIMVEDSKYRGGRMLFKHVPECRVD